MASVSDWLWVLRTGTFEFQLWQGHKLPVTVSLFGDLEGILLALRSLEPKRRKFMGLRWFSGRGVDAVLTGRHRGAGWATCDERQV